MLIQRATCDGIDCVLNKLQEDIYDYLTGIWGSDWKCYPRIYKNKRKTERGVEYFVPEYTDGNFEYNTDTLFDDRTNVVSYFLVDDTTDFSEWQMSTGVSLIFSALITEIYNNPERQDERMKLDIIEAIKQSIADVNLVSVQTGLDNVYREFKTEDLTWSNLSNRHLLRVNFTLNYSDC